MELSALSALSGYAYLQGGGGLGGVLAALPVAQASAAQTSALVASPGSVEVDQALGASQGAALTAGTFGLQTEAGQGAQALEALLNPPLGFANPFIAQAGLGSDVAPAYAAYQYAQAQQAGQAASYLKSLGTAVQTAAQGGVVDLLTPPAREEATAARARATAEPTTTANTARMAAGPMDANADGLVSLAEMRAYAFNHPALSPMDANLDGTVSATERLNYALGHPELDPKDANLDGYVSPAEVRAYALSHPAPRAVAGTLDLYA